MSKVCALVGAGLGLSITPGTKFDPDAIAAIYWQLHTQTPETWQVEYIYL